MRRLRSALAAFVVAAACAPLSPTAAAPSHTQAPSAASPSAGATVRPAAPTPSGATSGTPLSAIGPAAPIVPTPRPALGLPVLNEPCAEWPSDVATLMTELPLPPSVCLVRTTSAAVGHLVCTVSGCVPVAQGCADQGDCLQVVDGTTAHYVLVFIHPPASPTAPIGEAYTITRVLCRLHQYRSLTDIVLPGAPPPAGGWLATVEAREFRSAFAAFETTDAAAAQRWRPQGSDFEDYADVCAAWYYPAARDQRVADDPSLLAFAKKWLPLPQR
ncbi:MAG: hypothetical protein KGN00_02645 [Chloroflexota bacterium]|nr:hypothetical protein [Chloroflexota bacterium]MDE3192564.1 hypothetical protein [Chloroflexota bacterium]